jgi:hypothetical protein
MTTRTIISRKDAFNKGLKRFFTGEPCKRDHYCERFVVNGACVQCQNWTGPNRKPKGPKGNNVGWPAMGLVFNVSPSPEPGEMEAAFRYIEAMRWHDYALQELRKDPVLMLKHTVPPTIQEQAKAQAEVERQKAILRLARQRAAGE